MATKKELLANAVKAGKVAEGASEDDYTAEDLQTMLDPEPTAWKGPLSAKKPQVSPDGHVHLSQEDIDARN